MIVYHGSERIVKFPDCSNAGIHKDFGYGFYTTENLELAKEWACADNRNGFANRYEADLEGLKILNLNSPEYSILNWLAILARYRTYWQNSSIAAQAKDYLQEHFFIDPEQYDIVIGYRADDSYFTFAQDFVNNTISLSKLSEAMRLGKLGEQVVFKSRESLSHIHFTGAEPAEYELYYDRKMARDREARRAYRSTKHAQDGINELFMLDIMREEIQNGDPRLR